MSNSKKRAIDLANRALANNDLLANLPEDTYFKFVIGVAKYDKKKAMQLENIRSFTNPTNKVLFWEAVDILLKLEKIN